MRSDDSQCPLNHIRVMNFIALQILLIYIKPHMRSGKVLFIASKNMLTMWWPRRVLADAIRDHLWWRVDGGSHAIRNERSWTWCGGAGATIVNIYTEMGYLNAAEGGLYRDFCVYVLHQIIVFLLSRSSFNVHTK